MPRAPPNFPLSPSSQFAARFFGGYLGLKFPQSPYLESVNTTTRDTRSSAIPQDQWTPNHKFGLQLQSSSIQSRTLPTLCGNLADPPNNLPLNPQVLHHEAPPAIQRGNLMGGMGGGQSGSTDSLSHRVFPGPVGNPLAETLRRLGQRFRSTFR